MRALRPVQISLFIACCGALMLACSLGDLFSLAPAQPRLSQNGTQYTVKSGDTFGKIAEFYGVTVEELIALNKEQYKELARDPSLLKPGMVLTVPNRRTSLETRSAQAALEAERAVILAKTAEIIIERINVERAGKPDLTLLRTEVRLTTIAARRSGDMVQRDYFSHNDPATGQEPILRYLQADNYSYLYAGENLAEIKNDVSWVPSPLAVATRYTPTQLAEQLVTGWLNSRDHRLNIFNSRYHRTGVALAASSDGRRVVATQVFSD